MDLKYRDLVQKYICDNGLESAILKFIYKKETDIYICNYRKKKLCEIALIDLGYDLQKYNDNDELYKIDYVEILYDLLLVTFGDYSYLKKHDEMLKLCIQRYNFNLVVFILHTRNYFESILMLLLLVNKEINKQNINTDLLIKYLFILKKNYNIIYINEIKDKIKPFYLQEIQLYNLE